MSPGVTVVSWMLLVFCPHHMNSQDTAHHVPGVFGWRREVLRCVHSQARWQQADCGGNGVL